MVAVVLPDDLLALQLPQAGVVVGAGGDQVGAVGAEGAVPHPALVAGQGGLEGEGLGLAVGRRGLEVPHLPDLGGVVRAARRQLLDVGRQEDAGDVLLVRVEVRHGEELGAVVGLDQFPDEYVALEGEGGSVYVVCSMQQGSSGGRKQAQLDGGKRDIQHCLRHRAMSRHWRLLRWTQRHLPLG